MRLIPPEDASPAELQAAPKKLFWEQTSEIDGKYTLTLPGVVEKRQDRFIPLPIAHALDESLGPNWHVTYQGARLIIESSLMGMDDHGYVINAVDKLDIG